MTKPLPISRATPSEFSYAIRQVSGRPVDPRIHPGIDQSRNTRGETPGFVADFFRCWAGSPHACTTATYPDLASLDVAIRSFLERNLPAVPAY